MAGANLPARANELEILRQQFAPNAGDDELAYFAKVATHLDLDPWAGHICLMPIAGAHRPTITVAGRRYIADRTGRLRGIEGPAWRGRTVVLEDGTKQRPPYVEDWEPEDEDEDPYPYAARCLVYRSDWDRPANGTALWSEFSRWTKEKTDNRTGEITEPARLYDAWARMPSHMLGKVAESMALRRGFPEVQAAIAYVGGTDEDSTLLREVEAEGYVLAAAGAPTVGEVPRTPAPARARPPGPARDPDPERRPSSRREAERVPDWVYDQSPEAQGPR